MVERISIEVTNQCAKACWFCYNSSGPGESTAWTGPELISFVLNCAANGVKAVSFGGGEPLEFPELFSVLRELDGQLFRSITTNGLPLDQPAVLEQLVAARPDKVHLSIHFPDRPEEVSRVLRQVLLLQESGIKSGVNLVVSRSNIDAAEEAALRLRDEGIDNQRIIYLPMRQRDTPTPSEMSRVAGAAAFQSMSCLPGCASSPRFASIRWDKTVAWCSYTTARRPLPDLTWQGLTASLDGLGLTFCGGKE